MPPKTRVTGAIVGLGRIGFSTDQGKQRNGASSHERAFASCELVELVAACDPLPEPRERFKKARPDVKLYPSIDDMLKRQKPRPELVSICAPTRVHAELARRSALSGARAIFCEQPIAATTREAAELVALCKSERVALAVNHPRRWDPAFVAAAALVKKGAVGEVRSISSRYSGFVFGAGTHLVDAARMLCGGLKPLEASGWSADAAAEDPHVSGSVLFERGVVMTLACHAKTTDPLFEIDVVGGEGRLRVFENGAKTVWERFKPSKRFHGVRELAVQRLAAVKGGDRFVAAVTELCGLIGTGRKAACSGEDGYHALAAAEALAASARAGGAPQKIAPL